VPYVLLVLGALAGWALLPQMPPRLAVHWNIHGQADGFMSSAGAVAVMPALLLVLLLIMEGVPRLNGRAHTPAAQAMMTDARLTLTVFFLGMHALLLAPGLGYTPDVPRALGAMVGLLFAALGFSIARPRAEGPVPVNTPWPVHSPAGKARLSRAMGWAVAAAGVPMILGALLLPPVAQFAVLMASVLAMVAALLYVARKIAAQEAAAS
jgi:uncharacterized membrane protein